MQNKIEDIKYIQNAIWALYKNYLSDHDLAVYNRKIAELVSEVSNKGDKLLLSFCQNLLISWTPIINSFAEEFRTEVEHE